MVKKMEDEEQEEEGWGRRREDYYQNSDEQYSSLGEEEQEARRMHAQHLTLLDDNDYYQLPYAKSSEYVQNTLIDDTSSALSLSFLTTELTRVLKIGQNLPSSHSAHPTLQAYLMALIALKQLNVANIQHHPFLNKALGLRQKLQEALTARIVPIDQVRKEKTQPMCYEDVERERKQSKQKRRKDRKNVIQTQQMFACVAQSQARLASEKILKNKGLVRKRKKIDGNSRVKLRKKYQKKMSIHKAKPGHHHLENPGANYQGQKHIRTTKISSIKIK